MRHVSKKMAPGSGEPSDWPIPPSIWGLLQPRWIRLLRAFPVAVERGFHGPAILVAMANPDDLAAIDDIAFATGLRVNVLPVSQEEIDRAIAVHLDSKEPSASESGGFPVEVEVVDPPVRRP
jgi:hypothetical protein